MPLRNTGYTVNLLNQLTGRVNPSAEDVLGAANAQAEVRVNGLPTHRRGEYFHRELAVTNASAPAWTPVSVSAMQSGTTNTTVGNLHSPPVNEALVYDADGNLLHDGLWVYQWDAENRLLSVTSTNTVPSAGRRQVRWAYDSGGRRVRQTQAIWSGSAYTNAVDQKLLHDGWACVAELSSANSLQRQYIWGLDLSGTMTGAGGVGGLLWMLPSGGAARFAAYDGNGNVMGLVQNNGQFKAWYEYDPFGRTIRETVEDATTAHNPYKFSTKRAEAYTGLILYEYRVYDAKAGRWPSRDPIGEFGGINLYGFVGNSPLNRIDPKGLKAGGIIGGFVDCGLSLLSDAISKWLDQRLSCAEISKRSRNGSVPNPGETESFDIDLCKGLSFQPNTFQPTYDPKSLGKLLGDCLFKSLKGKAIEEAIKEVPNETKRKILEELLKTASDFEATAKLTATVNAKCNGSKVVATVKYSITAQAGGMSMSEEVRSLGPFGCPALDGECCSCKHNPWKEKK